MKYLNLLLIFFNFLILNCKSEVSNNSEIQRNIFFYLVTPQNSNPSNDSAEPYQTTFANNCKTVSSSIVELEGANSDFPQIIDDMIFSNQNDSSVGRSAFKTGCSNLWNGAVVPFEIDPMFSNVDILYSAFKAWESSTVIRFIKRTNIHRDYIYITPSTLCSSYVGRIGGSQNVNLASNCNYKNILHELGHAIGFYHEHQRVDRDNFISIRTENILADKLINFNKLFPSYSYSSYDIHSIMHYTPFSFSANSKPTITLKDETTNFGNSGMLSSLDTENANALYINNFKVINNIPSGYYR
jgi:hypothetical protein